MTKTSQRKDRVVFVSLIDILLQLSFVLLALVLYVFNDYSRVLILNSDLEKPLAHAKVLEDENEKLKIQNDGFKKRIDELTHGNLIACIPATAIRATREKSSLLFKAIDNKTLQFQGFTLEYLNYLDSKNLTQLKNIAENMNKNSKDKNYNVDDIEKNFAFIREPDCYHIASVIDGTGGKLSSPEMDKLRGKVSNTVRRLKEANE